MEPDVRERFERIESVLHAMVERENKIEAAFNRRMDRAEQRMERAEQRMEKFDRRLDATLNIVKTGMKLLARLEQNTEGLRAEIANLAKAQKAFVDSLRKGSNGSKH